MPRVKVVSLQGKKGKDVDLPDDVYATALNSHLIHEAVVAYQAAGRAGTHSTKNRSDVRGGGQKPWKQKKTGRSRHGSSRSPLWRGGGTVFGPQPRDYSYTFPRKKRHGALRSALSEKLREGNLLVLESLELEEVKTKTLVAAIQRLGIAGSALLVDEPMSDNVALSARNVPGLKTTRSTALNVVDVLKYDSVVLTEAAARRVAEVLG